MRNTEIVLLNASNRCRIVDDPCQWIVEVMDGAPRAKNRGWRPLRWCRTRRGLEISLRELFGPDCPAIEKIAGWPPIHPDRLTAPADYGGGERAAA